MSRHEWLPMLHDGNGPMAAVGDRVDVLILGPDDAIPCEVVSIGYGGWLLRTVDDVDAAGSNTWVARREDYGRYRWRPA